MTESKMSFYKEDGYSTVMKDVIIFNVTEKDAPSWVKVGAKYKTCKSLNDKAFNLDNSMVIIDVFCITFRDDNNTYLIARLGWDDEMKKNEQRIEVLIK